MEKKKLKSLEGVDSRFKDISEQMAYLSQYRIYVAGKLNGMACDYIKHLRRMIVEGEKVRKEGFSIFTPGIDFLCGLVLGNWNYEDYFQNSQAWLEASHGMYIQGDDWETSNGTKDEIERAKRIEIPIFYGDIKEMKNYFLKFGENGDKTNLKPIIKECDSKLVDVSVGPMSTKEVQEELRRTMHHGPLESVVVLMERDETIKEYKARIYVSKKDFKKYY